MKQLAVLAVLLFTLPSFGQSTRVDGRKHPELIRDNIAYELVLRLQSQEDARLRELQHARIGLSAEDHAMYDAILADFGAKIADLEATHNAAADRAEGNVSAMNAELTGLKTRLAAIVSGARAQLAARLSVDGYNKLDAFIQGEKSNMTVGVKVNQ